MRREFWLNRRIADDTPAYVVAELGQNHGGNVPLACQMVEGCADAGADAVKLQKRDNATLYTAAMLDTPYDHEHSYGLTYGTHRAALELDAWGYGKIQACAQHRGLTCFATAFDEPSVDFLLEQGLPALKLASGALTDVPLQQYAAAARVPLLLSTGGGTIQAIDAAVERITAVHPQLALLHCTAAYPCDMAELNLRCIGTLRDRYPALVIGYSGHDDGMAMSLIAYALGARIIEKHVTHSHSAKGTDHAFSLEPDGLKRLCRDLKRAHVALGDGVKVWYESERKPLSKMRRVPTPEGWKITGDLPVCVP